ncbi:MAG: hypothetical protein KGI27_01775 [Thaumarchaeota archaeon]|nr:hypothetical protein [Nitrososphaerota archaeon]
MDDFGIYAALGSPLAFACICLVVWFKAVRNKTWLQQHYNVFRQRQNLVGWFVIIIKAIWAIVIASAAIVPVIITFGMSSQLESPLLFAVSVPVFCLVMFVALRKVKI